MAFRLATRPSTFGYPYTTTRLVSARSISISRRPPTLALCSPTWHSSPSAAWNPSKAHISECLHSASSRPLPVRAFSTNNSTPQTKEDGDHGQSLPQPRQGEDREAVAVAPAREPFSLQPYLQLSRIDKPIGTWLLFWPCAWSITLAAHHLALPPSVPAWYIALFGIGAIVMRGAGCTINDMWDAKMDRQVERTKTRPLAAGDVTHFQALCFLGLQLTTGLGVLVNLNWYSILLGASSLSVVTIYPLMKRITHWPQFVLGLAFNWGAMLGWAAVAGSCNWAVVLPLYAGSVGWTLVYDTIYAHQDKTDDVSAGVKSTALLFGDATKPVLTGFSLSFLSLLAYSVHKSSPLVPALLASSSETTTTLTTLLSEGHPFFLASLAGAAAHLFWQLRTVDLADRPDCWNKFCSNKWLGWIVWAGLAGDYAVQVGVPALMS